ncbi:hypothetical protein AB0H29_32960 [Streptomyces thermolilacinus]
MPGLMNRLKEFGRSAQGRRVTDSARRAAADPRKREQARQLFGKLRGGRR